MSETMSSYISVIAAAGVRNRSISDIYVLAPTPELTIGWIEQQARDKRIIAAQKGSAVQWLTTRGLQLPNVVQAIKNSAVRSLQQTGPEINDQAGTPTGDGAFSRTYPDIRFSRADTLGNITAQLKDAMAPSSMPIAPTMSATPQAFHRHGFGGLGLIRVRHGFKAE